ncbi:MAG: hypothetical protein K2L94_04320 [Alphaproteobacteria bacterium]|nr:hypothetical protein [Alphaproteobacteria bacterium]
MFYRKNHIIVGLTTFNTEFLRISVPGLARFGRRVFLVLHNDNPAVRIRRRDIRRLGFRGRVHIINADENVGPMRARLNILATIQKLRLGHEWMVFCDDDDILTNIDIPTVAEHNFAVLQNMIEIRGRLIDVLRAMDNPCALVPDDEDVILHRPHIGMAGTLVRTKLMCAVGELIADAIDAFRRIDDSLDYRAPDDAALWQAVAAYARHQNPAAAPIYMDRVNYVGTNVDTAARKYGRLRFPAAHAAARLENALCRYATAWTAVIAKIDPGL